MFLETAGFVGAMLAVLLATVVVLMEVGQITELSRAISPEMLTEMQTYALVAGIIYGIKVRAVALQEEDEEFGLWATRSTLVVDSQTERIIVKILSNLGVGQSVNDALDMLDDHASLVEYGELVGDLYMLSPILIALHATVSPGKYQEFFDIYNRETSRLEFGNFPPSSKNISHIEASASILQSALDQKERKQIRSDPGSLSTVSNSADEA